MSETGYSVEGDPIWAVLDGVPSMLAYWDRNLLCRFANRAYERWFGKKGSSLYDTSIRDLLGPELFALNEPYIRAALNGEAQEFERLVPGPGGILRPSLACYIPHVVDGKVQGFVVQVTDVTALHTVRSDLEERVAECARANEILRKTRSELELAQRLGEMGSWTWDIDQDVIKWSSQLYEIFGLEPDRPPPTFAMHDALYTVEATAILKTHVQRAIDFGLPYTLELEYFHRSGRRGWLEARGSALRDASGRVVQLHGTAQEVTARRIARQSATQAMRIEQLERELANEKSRSINAPAGRVAQTQGTSGLPSKPGEYEVAAAPVLDQGGEPQERIESVQAAARRALSSFERLQAVRATGLLDSEREESFDSLTSLAARLLKVPACFISIVDEKRDFYKSQFGLPDTEARGLSGQTLCHYTLERNEPLIISDTHASELWRNVPTVHTLGVRAYVGVPLISDGQNIGSFCVVDMVPRLWSVEELEILRQMASSAMREIDLRAAVSAAAAMAVSARAHALERERFVSVVAHDLRTPLQILQLATSLVQKNSSNDLTKVTARMQSALTMMKTMVDGLMRPNADGPIVRQPIELADLGRDAVEMMAPIAMKAASFLLLGNFPSAIVRVDYSQMLRVLGNLIGNALKYSPAGSCVELAGRRTDGIVELTVTDHGVGMYESEVARAFDHGWQGVDGQARGDGAGLGLAIVKSLVEQQNGTVAIASTPGVGTVVTITLPCW